MLYSNVLKPCFSNFATYLCPAMPLTILTRGVRGWRRRVGGKGGERDGGEGSDDNSCLRDISPPLLTTCHPHSLQRRDNAKEHLLLTIRPGHIILWKWWWWVNNGRRKSDHAHVRCPTVIARHCKSWADGGDYIEEHLITEQNVGQRIILFKMQRRFEKTWSLQSWYMNISCYEPLWYNILTLCVQPFLFPPVSGGNETTKYVKQMETSCQFSQIFGPL